MDEGAWWLRLYLRNEPDVIIWLHSQTRIEATATRE